jgi:hypothetical protein
LNHRRWRRRSDVSLPGRSRLQAATSAAIKIPLCNFTLPPQSKSH